MNNDNVESTVPRGSGILNIYPTDFKHMAELNIHLQHGLTSYGPHRLLHPNPVLSSSEMDASTYKQSEIKENSFSNHSAYVLVEILHR